MFYILRSNFLLVALAFGRTTEAFSLPSRIQGSAIIDISTTKLQSSIVSITSTGGITTNNASPKLQQNPILMDDDQEEEAENIIMDIPKVGSLMKMFPPETFDIHTPTSLFYFGIDFAAVATTMGFLNSVVTSEAYHSFPILLQALTVIPLQILTGFAMWCMWCIGHDAGHNTVSKNNVINRFVGEIAHSVICLTPFVPWAKSHRMHHLNHNHLERDYSHQWYISEERDNLAGYIKAGHMTRNIMLPFLYFVYLFLGVPDGGHVFFYGRMWEDSNWKEKLNAYISSLVSITTAGLLWHNMGTADFVVVCMIPWLVCSFWLFMVTYLQHHSEDGKLYTDKTYTFEKGAFETVDRNYGKWINRLSHHMMDGHVVHHLFFTKVPHYRLENATKALVKGLNERGLGHVYKQIDTPNFTQEILKQFDENWFFVNERNVVRK